MASNATHELNLEPGISVGSSLRNQRESLGLTLRDLSAITKIPPAQLQYLEEDRFEEFSAEVFARGFLCNYARELRLDVDAVTERYFAQIGRASAASATHSVDLPVAPTSEVRSLLAHPSAIGRVLYGAALAIFVIGLGVAVIAFGGRGDEPSAAYNPTDYGDAWQQLPTGQDDWNSSREN